MGSQYTVYLGGDGNYYVRKKTDGMQGAFSETTSAAQATLALALSNMRTQILTETFYNEVAV